MNLIDGLKIMDAEQLCAAIILIALVIVLNSIIGYIIIVENNYTLGIAMLIPIAILTAWVIKSGLLSNSQVGRLIMLNNIERRTKSIKKHGAKKFLETFNATLIHESKRGNKLYESWSVIKGRQVKLLVYKDSSTDREYIKFVPRGFEDADKAQAWGCGLTPELYEKMEVES